MMRTKARTCAPIGVATLVAACAAAVLGGCSVGAGAPDGWRYLRAGTVAVAHPKSWQEVRSGAVLRGPRGRTDGELTVTADPPVSGSARPGPPAAGAPAAGGPEAATAPASARSEALDFGGHPGRLLSYPQRERAAGDRPVDHVEVRLRDSRGHDVVVRAWTADLTADPMVLREIVDSIEIS